MVVVVVVVVVVVGGGGLLEVKGLIRRRAKVQVSSLNSPC